MSARFSKMPNQDGSSGYEHGPKPAQRISRGDYTEDFLRGLQIRGEVTQVNDDWNEESSSFPPSVTWVMYPNGDLQRIGYN
jgi:hypothetical protein